MATSKIKEPNYISSSGYLWERGTRYGSDWSFVHYSVSGRVCQLIFYVRESTIGSLASWQNYSLGRLPFSPADNLWMMASIDRQEDIGTQFQVNYEGYVYLSTRYNSITGGRGDVFRGTLTFLINS